MNSQSPTIDLYIARHAESVMNLTPQIICGQSIDAELTPRGKEQALALGHGLHKAGIVPDLVFTSPAKRCQQTGRRALLAMGLPAMPWVVDEDLLEVGQGEWEGQNRRKMYTDDVLQRVQEDPLHFRAPSGQSLYDAQLAGLRFLGKAVEHAAKIPEPATFLAFGHGLHVRMLAGAMLGWPVQQIKGFEMPNGGSTKLRYEQDAWSVEFIGQPIEELAQLA